MIEVLSIPTIRLKPLLGLDDDELRKLAESMEQPGFRGPQLARWLYRDGVASIDGMMNLPSAFRKELTRVWRVGRSQTALAQYSRDGTLKMLLQLADGQRVETVGLPYDGWLSCCVSSQVGCPVSCAFCATGRSGYTRNLNAGEIVDQVLTIQQAMREQSGLDRKVNHVVFMGMGEPLMNYDNVLKAVHLLNREVGIGMRNLTVSTVGYVPAIQKLAAEHLQLTLAISLHAPNDALRRRLIPTMTKWSVGEIVDAARDYASATGRRVTFEYCLLRDENDGPEQARELAHLLKGMLAHVNLIPYNTVEGLGFYGPSMERVRAFRAVLEQMGIEVTQRAQRGADIDAACGQLRRRQELAAKK